MCDRLLGLALVSLAVAAIGLVACRPGGGDRGPGVLLRFIDSEVGSSRGRVDVYREEQVFHWSFRNPELASLWQPGNIDIDFRQRNLGLFMRSSTNDPHIVREGIELDATEVDTVRVRHSWIDSSYMQIFWAAAGEPFQEAKSLRVEGVENGGLLEPTYAFDVRSVPEWNGMIGRFRLDSSIVPERRLMVFWIEGTKRVLDAEKLAAAIADPGAIDLGGDSRLALLAPTGYPHERRLRLPVGARLEASLGLMQTQGEKVTFRVFVEHGDETQEVFSRTLDPVTDGGRWFPVSVPLPATRGREALVRLVTEGPDPEEQRHGLPAWGHPEIVSPEAPVPQGPSVVLIMLDTLRADRMSLYGHDVPTTPRLDRWAAERAVVFENAVASSPWTLPSHASLFTGLDSIRHGANYGDAVAASLDLLAERLRRAGWQTAAFTGGGYLRPSFGLAQGFDRFTYWRDSRSPGNHRRVGGDLDAHLEPALEWLGRERRSPFFLFFHTYEVHAPYTDRQPWFDRFAPPEHAGKSYFVAPRPGVPDPAKGWRYDPELTKRIEGKRGLHPIDASDFPLMHALYDSGVAKVDDAVGRILDRLAELGLEDDAVVIITSDHGEALGEKGLAGHAFLYDFNLMIPLIIALPDGRGAGSRIPAQVRLVDVAPTIAELVDLPVLPDIDGRSLLPYWDDPERQAPRVAESYAGSSNRGMSLRLANRYKYVYHHSPWRPLHGQEELYDLQSDAAEEDNLAAAEADLSRRFRERLIERYETHASHLSVKLQNRTEHEIRYEVRSHIASTVTVKAIETPWCQEGEPDCVAWIRGWTVVTLDPGESALLNLGGTPFNELKVKMSSPTGTDAGVIPPEEPFKLYVQEVLERPYRLRLEAGGWQRLEDGEGLDATDTGVELTWKNSLWSEGGEAGTVVDEETRRQLEALGYAK